MGSIRGTTPQQHATAQDRNKPTPAKNSQQPEQSECLDCCQEQEQHTERDRSTEVDFQAATKERERFRQQNTQR